MAEVGLPKDLFEWMQKMWNPMSFPIPGMMTPTANIDEIQAKIRDLKSVETWLTMNVGFNYNAILNNFGVTFELIPNVVAVAHRPGTRGLSGGGFH